MMGEITCDGDGSVCEAGAAHFLKGGKRGPDDLLCCSHDALEGPVARCGAGAILQGDAAGLDALDGSGVES